MITQQLLFVSAPSVLNYLYFGSKNIISGMTSGTGSVFSTENGKCPTQVLSFTAVQTDPLLWLNGRLFVNTQVAISLFLLNLPRLPLIALDCP